MNNKKWGKYGEHQQEQQHRQEEPICMNNIRAVVLLQWPVGELINLP
jgi:hypothetical protein